MILFGMKIMRVKKSAKNVSDYSLAEHLAINYPKTKITVFRHKPSAL